MSVKLKGISQSTGHHMYTPVHVRHLRRVSRSSTGVTSGNIVTKFRDFTKYQTYIYILQRFISKFYIMSSTSADVRHFKLEFP